MDIPTCRCYFSDTRAWSKLTQETFILQQETFHLMSSSSFRRSTHPSSPQAHASSSTTPPSGTRISVHHQGRIFLTSTGCYPLDCVFGGGLPSGSLTLVKGSGAGGYTDLVQHLYLAQGIASHQAICLIGDHFHPATGKSAADENQALLGYLSARLPAIVEGREEGADAPQSPLPGLPVPQPSSPLPMYRAELEGLEGQFKSKLTLLRGASTAAAPTRMNIAWRYNGQTQHAGTLPPAPPMGAANDTLHGIPYCHQFDLTKPMAAKTLAHARISVLAIQSLSTTGGSLFAQTLDHITRVLQSLSPTRDYLRIAIKDFGSWSWIRGSDAPARDMVHFILALKALIQGKNASVHLTVPAHLYAGGEGGGLGGDSFAERSGDGNSSGAYIIRRLEHCVDAVLELEAFEGSARTWPDAYTSQYNGLLKVHKLPSPFALTAAPTSLSALDLQSLAFKVRRKRFCIDVFTLPPDDEERDEGPSASLDISSPRSSGGSCGGMTGTRKSNPLDF